MPTVAQEHCLDASDVGLLIGAIATGALLANPLIGGRNNSRSGRCRLMAMGLFLSAPGMILLGVTPEQGLAVDVVAGMLVGFGWEFVFVSGQSTVAVDAQFGCRDSLSIVAVVMLDWRRDRHPVKRIGSWKGQAGVAAVGSRSGPLRRCDRADARVGRR